jgi:hypothetical protein
VTKRQAYYDAEREIRRRKDLIGHAFIVLESPVSRRVVGFYPEQIPSFEMDWLAFWCLRRFWHISQWGMTGALLDDEDHLTDPHYECRSKLYPLSQQQFTRAEKFIAEFERGCQDGRVRYHVCNQCASFALKTLKAAGVGPRVRIPYPPLLFRWLYD